MFLHNLKSSVTVGIIVILPVYCWTRFLRFLLHTAQDECDESSFRSKHNCIVHYSPEKGIRGWQSDEFVKAQSEKVIEFYCEPLLYFIKTAKKSLDIAVMTISLQPVFNALSIKLKDGVKVRIITDGNYMGSNELLHNLGKAGAKIRFYIEDNSIMHLKYAVKDYNGQNGYLTLGSMNWTTNAVVQNYDDIVFTSNSIMVKSFNRNFQETWDYITETYNENNTKVALHNIRENFRRLDH